VTLSSGDEEDSKMQKERSGEDTSDGRDKSDYVQVFQLVISDIKLSNEREADEDNVYHSTSMEKCEEVFPSLIVSHYRSFSHLSLIPWYT